jgi:glycosyltransferase involved in cell wall biosynthesis
MVPGISNMLKPGVSVVVCCYNSGEVIVPTIKALSRQEVPPDIEYEVILVDNNCTDNTVQLSKDTWKNPSFPLRIVKEKEPGLIYARKTGVKSARYDILLFVDDDNILNPDWVTKLYHLYQEMPKVAIIGGYNQALIQGNKPSWFDRFENVYACGPRDDKPGLNPQFLFGAGLSFRTRIIKSVLFSDLPLFLVGRTKNTLIRGEDTEMSLRCLLLGWDSYYDSSLRLQHNLLSKRVNWNYVCQAKKGGGTARVVLKMYRDLLNNTEPWCFSMFVRHVLREWKKHFIKHKKNIFHFKKPGSEASFQFYWLLGVSRGLFLYRKTYHRIREKISEYFKTKTDK